MKKLLKSKEVTPKPVAPQFKLKTGLKAGDAGNCMNKASELLKAGQWSAALEELKKCA